MIIVLKENPSPASLDLLTERLKALGLGVHRSEGASRTIIGLIGDTSALDVDLIRSIDIVDEVKRIQEPYKNANRKFHPADTVIRIGKEKIGGGHFLYFAGPCSVETREQVFEAAGRIKKAGGQILRGGAFKPRTSPYSFQGLRGEGIALLAAAKVEFGLPIVTEIMDLSQLSLFEPVDVIQVGARNMQNFELLKELGHLRKPILLKRGLANTLEEFLMSAEYIMAGGNEEVILCERGIRTFETAMRNTLDLAGVTLLKSLTHLPVIVDPSHATGMSRLVKPMAMAATAAGADGLMVEVHPNPAAALCDGPQSLTCDAFDDLVRSVEKIRPVAFHW